MITKIYTIIFLLLTSIFYIDDVFTASNSWYTENRIVDKNTFNEYKYKLTDAYFDLRNHYDINWDIDKLSAANLLILAEKGYKYLPDDLENKNLFNYLKTSILRWIKYPNNSSNYKSIERDLESFIEKTNIKSIVGKIEAFPSIWNAPLVVTFRSSVADQTWSKINDYDYTWWMNVNWTRKILWHWISYRHTFKSEWTFWVFLEVKSSHKNKNWFIDVLPFFARQDVLVKEKIASIIVKVNTQLLNNKSILKYTPDEAKYGLVFDATSSIPTSGSKFIRTEWDFWNWQTSAYFTWPKVERVIYNKEWEYDVKLILSTNEWKTIKRNFVISVHDPISTIRVSSDSWYLWDKFTFSARKNISDKNLSYSWEILDLENDTIIFNKQALLITYKFNKKWKYNVKMKVIDSTWQEDVDSRIIYINSRPPEAKFEHKINEKNKPNKIFLDATKSFDPDYTDDWKLEYKWIINWERVELINTNYNNSNWYFIFDSIWDHSVVLEVKDPDWISAQMKKKVNVKSILSLDFNILPRVTQRNNNIKFVATSKEAKFYEWDFGDWDKKWWNNPVINHKYTESGIYIVTLKVIDKTDNTNTFSKNVYIWESDAPYWYITITDNLKNNIPFNKNECDWEWAYVLNKVDSIQFSAENSININWKSTWLNYSWKLWKETFNNSMKFLKKFDELWCFKVQLTVTSKNNYKTHTVFSNIVVKNLKPELSAIDVRVTNLETDPVIVNVSAIWAKDRDWIIQSYLWYYYTDMDPEPQDFRSTKNPNTNFVLPKIWGNYYFVVVMKDNNEARINSEQITWSKYFVTLAWDNLNTPLIKLSVNDSSIAIWDKVTLTANVRNILDQDLSKKAEYSWDFDWDGFYDKKTKSNTVSHIFLDSWEKHTKVKVKYKGFSNTKSLTISVSNILKPDFWYISIWNKVIFVDKSIWSSDSNKWDLGDGTIIQNKSSFIHTYTDGKSIHDISLKIIEWTKTKTKVAKVIKNVKNYIKSRKSGLIIYSIPDIKDDNIILEEQTNKIYFYLWESKPEINFFAIDNDISIDSDMNWWDDDDVDNKQDESYKTWNLYTLELNDQKYQTIRIFIKWKNDELIDSKDITIQKNFINDSYNQINPDTIIFEWVSDFIKAQIEKLKIIIASNDFPKQHKLKSMMFLQKLQAEWDDNREKTNIILDFESFIYDINISNTDEIIEILEWLLVENQEDKSEMAIAYNALKNLVPLKIECKDSIQLFEQTCYEYIIDLLTKIRDSDLIEDNKKTWKKILDIIIDDQVMSVKNKTDFKAILETIVYRWIKNIPEKEIVVEKEEWNIFINLLFSIFKWIFIIIIIFGWLFGWFYLYFIFVNKNKNIAFQDFIIEKTQGIKKSTINEQVLKENIIKEPTIKEPVNVFGEEKNIKQENITQENNNKKVEQKNEDTKIQWKKEVNVDTELQVPDWLKWNFPEQEKDKQEQDKQKEYQKINKDETKKIENINKEQNKESILITDEDIKQEEKLPEDNIPDWLKWSFQEDTNKKEEEKEYKKEKIEKKIEQKVEKKIEKKIEKKEQKKVNIKPEVKKTETPKKQKSIKKELKTQKDVKTKPKKQISVKKKKQKEELWDDGMKIPDWLQNNNSNDWKKKENPKK